MHFPVEGTRKTLLFFTVLAAWAIGYCMPAEEKTLNVRIGFDLTRGEDGAPSLRVRDFEDSGDNDRFPRAVAKEDRPKEKSPKKLKPSVRADSFSDSSAEEKPIDDSSKEQRRQSSGSDENSYDSDNNRHKSTKGMNAENYDPKEDVKIHGTYSDDDGGASAEKKRQYRLKRQVIFDSGKRKGKKVRARKHGVARA